MDKNEMIKKIQYFSENKKREENERCRKLEEERINLEQRVRKLIPRMRDMYDVMLALYESGIENNDFTTDGIDHGIGFFTNTMNIRSFRGNHIVCHPLREFGIEGGGCDGPDFVIDLDTEAIYRRNSSERYIGHMKEVLNKFDAFEEKLNQFIKNLK